MRKVRLPKENESAEKRPDGIGPRLAEIREKAQIGQAELARQLEVSRFALNRWERGHRSVPSEQIGPVCRVLGADPAGVLGVRKEQPLPSVTSRLLRLFGANGTDTAGRHLGVDPVAMNAVLSGRLLIAEAELAGLAEAYEVSFAWLLTGKPEHWTKPMETSWVSRLRFFRITIGGFRPYQDLIEGSELAETITTNLENLFRDGERSEAEARNLLKGTGKISITGTLAALKSQFTAWSKALELNFPYDFDGLIADKPRFKV